MIRPDGRVAAVILAAGASRRFGGDKSVADLGGRPLVCWVVETARAANLAPIQVVGPSIADALGFVVAKSVTAILPNPEATSGMGTSIALGLQSLVDLHDVEAAVLFHADRPYVSVDLVSALVAAFHRLGRDAIAPSFRGTIAPPVLVARPLWPELLAMRGDQGGKRIILRDPSRLAVLELDEAMPLDIDTRQDLAVARQSVTDDA